MDIILISDLPFISIYGLKHYSVCWLLEHIESCRFARLNNYPAIGTNFTYLLLIVECEGFCPMRENVARILRNLSVACRSNSFQNLSGKCHSWSTAVYSSVMFVSYCILLAAHMSGVLALRLGVERLLLADWWWKLLSWAWELATCQSCPVPVKYPYAQLF